MQTLALSRTAIMLWLLRHATELPGVIPLLKDAAQPESVEEAVDDLIAILQWVKPIVHDFPDASAASVMSADDEAKVLGIFGGDGGRLKKLIDALGGLAGIINLIRGITG